MNTEKPKVAMPEHIDPSLSVAETGVAIAENINQISETHSAGYLYGKIYLFPKQPVITGITKA